MGLNLIELMNGYLTPEVLSKASTFIGENEKATTSAVGSIIPTLLGGLLHKASDEVVQMQLLLYYHKANMMALF